MSTIHEVKCDYCGVRANMKWNGEHWLSPADWRQIYDDNKAEALDEHICPDCQPKKIKAKVKK